MISLSDETNAHVADCEDPDAFDNLICCKAGQMPERVEFSGVPSTWSTTSTQVSLSCGENDPDCDDSSLIMKIFPTEQETCPENYIDYDQSGGSSKLISSHAWVCGAGQDFLTKVYFFSTPREILVDRINPTITDLYAYEGVWVNSPRSIRFSASDTGDSGLAGIKHCFGVDCDPTEDVIGTQLTVDYSYEGILRYQVSDIAGNPSGIGQVGLMIDVDNPITTDR